ncbi:MAG: competence/damage-inducible protein A, partial [Planctomycetota bacterium]|nr:competence/damage-inducible protein A [Planctomycetota bacterium]
MRAEIVAIGSELTSGAKLDTNSQWLSLQLAELGIPVAYHTTMADSLEAMTEVFQIASGRCDLVLITGGLGPTLDDITRQAMAALAEVELVLDETSLAHITELFARRRRPMPDRNRIQAMLPAGSRA